MSRNKFKTSQHTRSVEDDELDYLVKKASVPREQARALIKRIREDSRDTDQSNFSSSPTYSLPEYELKIRARAYELWEEAGRPLGRELDHWFAAEKEFAGTPSGFDLPSNHGNVQDADRYKESRSPESHDSGPAETANPPAGLPLVRPLSDN